MHYLGISELLAWGRREKKQLTIHKAILKANCLFNTSLCLRLTSVNTSKYVIMFEMLMALYFILENEYQKILLYVLLDQMAIIQCSASKSCLTLCEPMACSMPGFPVLACLPEFAQIHVHWVSDATSPSHPLQPSSPLPSVFPSIFSSKSALCIRWPKYSYASASYDILKFFSLRTEGEMRSTN